jgi:hypothetical protein
LKSFLVIALKNAVNAVLTNAALMTMFSGTFHLHSWAGVLNILKAAGIAVAVREGQIWVPKLLAWSTSPTNGNVADPAAQSSASKYNVR